MTNRNRVLLALFLLASVLPLSGASDRGNAARAEHQRVVEFWTHERVAQAVPRDFVFDPGTGGFVSGTPGANKKPDNPGGGNGGGGGGGKPGGGDGDTDVVTGSSYKDGGDIDYATGKVLFSIGSSYYVCSATLITDTEDGRSLVATAGHCAYDETDPDDGYAQNWVFIPDYDAAPAPLSTSSDSYCDDTAYGCWPAVSLVVHSGFASAGGFNDQAVRHDFAIAVMGVGGKSTDPSLTLLNENAYAQTAQFTNVSIDGSEDLTTGWAFGYPAAKKWKGDDLIYCSGPVDGDPFNSDSTYRMNECKMTGGSSGGGWLHDFADGSGLLFSVNSYGYTGINAMHGPKLGTIGPAVYNEALTATSNTKAG